MFASASAEVGRCCPISLAYLARLETDVESPYLHGDTILPLRVYIPIAT